MTMILHVYICGQDEITIVYIPTYNKGTPCTYVCIMYARSSYGKMGYENATAMLLVDKRLKNLLVLRLFIALGFDDLSLES